MASGCRPASGDTLDLSLALGWEHGAGHTQTKGTGNGARRSERAPPVGRRAALFAASKGSRPQPARPLPKAAAVCAGAAINHRGQQAPGCRHRAAAAPRLHQL